MQVAVIGAGIVGTLTAHYLNTLGAEVTVLDRSSHAGALTSRANGGQLSYSFCDALADPQLLPKLPGILFGMDPAFRIRPKIDLDFVKWGLRFIRECTKTRRDQNTLALLAKALRSEELMRPLLERLGEQSAYSRPGKLVLLSRPGTKELERRCELKRASGVKIDLITAAQALDIEPALNHWQWQPAAALYSPGDEVADAHLFTQLLASDLKTRGVAFEYGTAVSEVNQVNGATTVRTLEQELKFDAVVLATGHMGQSMLRQAGIRAPILPMAGYSVTLPATSHSMQTSVTALEHRLVFSRLEKQVRIAGFSDVNPAPRDLEHRAVTLRSTARDLAPCAADYRANDSCAWQGIRAMTPNSRPLVGRTKQTNIFVNMGHGMLGWTLGAATASEVANQVMTQLS